MIIGLSKNQLRRPLLSVLLATAALTGCGQDDGEPDDTALVDAATLDAPVADAAVRDGSIADATISDAAVKDGAITDAAGITDAAISDSSSSDAAIADAATADAAITDAGADVDAACAAGSMTVTLTSEAYDFGYGDGTSIASASFVQGAQATTAGQIYNCSTVEPNPSGGAEVYSIDAASLTASSYLYVIAWDNESGTQGVLGQFKRPNGTLYTGDLRFQACATGIAGDSSGPTLTTINQQIAICNAGTGGVSTTSAGWVDGNGAVTAGASGTLAIGEANDSAVGGDFPIACGTEDHTTPPIPLNTIDHAARWMWYLPSGFFGDPFVATGTNTFRAFLIFRISAPLIGCP